MLMGKTLNGNMMCSVALRTTGNDPDKDEIYHICILPLDLNYSPMYGQIFDRFVRVRLENMKKVQEKDRVFAKKHSVVWDQFDEWCEKTIKKGQIIPIVYDWPLVSRFLKNFISEPGFKIAFCDKPRDLKVIGGYLNDLHEVEGLQLPFSKTTMRYILNNCDASLPLKYNAMQQAISMSKAYKRMLRFPF